MLPSPTRKELLGMYAPLSLHLPALVCQTQELREATDTRSPSTSKAIRTVEVPQQVCAALPTLRQLANSTLQAEPGHKED